jgi:hypothetical protein
MTIDDTPERQTSPADPNDSGTGIGSDVKQGHDPGSPSDEESSGKARDATGGHAPMDDDPTPR